MYKQSILVDICGTTVEYYEGSLRKLHKKGTYNIDIFNMNNQIN